jgi:DNA-binding NarL/FixJ family response regulator
LTTNEARVRVGVVAADPLRRIGLVAILEESLNLEACPMEMEAAMTAEGMVALLLDMRAPIDAISETVGRLRREQAAVKVMVMGPPLQASDVQAIIGSGAKGYLAETASEGEIRMAVEVVLDGSIWAPRKVLAKLIDQAGLSAANQTASGAGSVEGLMTRRELEVLHLLMDGKTNRDIAQAMGIDEVTVKAHLGRMLRKTNSNNRVELTLRAMEERGQRARFLRGE